jgi:hypothetical protein
MFSAVGLTRECTVLPHGDVPVIDFGSVMIEKQPVMGSDLKTPNANNRQRRTRRLPLAVQHVAYPRVCLTESRSRQTTEPRGRRAALRITAGQQNFLRCRLKRSR